MVTVTEKKVTDHDAKRIKQTPKQKEEHKRQLLEAMQKSLGVVTLACNMVGLARETYYGYYKTDPEFAKACDDCGEIAIDFAESQLHKQIRDGVPASTIFYLKTKAKKRGYVERTENDLMTDGKPLGVVFLPMRQDLPEKSNTIPL